VSVETAIDRLERRVTDAERDLKSLRERNQLSEVERAKQLLFTHLKEHTDVEPVRFAVQNDLSLEAVELALEDFDRRGWTVPAHD
jgi:hypothetical protein